MILYKYVSFEAAKAIIDSSTLGFSQPKYFNDPFDTPTYPEEKQAGPIEQIRLSAKNTVWGENTGILSLTRTPTNALMWAHYADKHRGLVIGIDAAMARLTDEKTNLIPAQFGSVVYVSQRPLQPFIGKPEAGIAVGSTYHFPKDHFEKLQRLFLHKPVYWAYEEEVRVVKCIKSIPENGGQTPSGEFFTKRISGQPLHLFKIPVEAIREVYLGFRMDIQASEAYYYHLTGTLPHASVYDCTLLANSFEVGIMPYAPITESEGP